MDQDPNKPIDLEPEDEPPPGAADAPSVPGDDATDGEPEPAGIKALDVCPHCGSTLPSVNTLVCLRCGWDFKANRRIKVKVQKPVADEDTGEAIGPMSPAGLGDRWLPAAVALSAALLLTVGYIVGAAGLVPPPPGDQAAGAAAPIAARLLALLKFYLQVVLISGCGVGALYALARAAARPLGDLQLAAVRMAAVVAAISLVRLIDLPSNSWELLVEILLQAAAFVGLSMLLFRLALSEALSLLGWLLLAVLTLLVAAGAVWWVLVP